MRLTVDAIWISCNTRGRLVTIPVPLGKNVLPLKRHMHTTKRKQLGQRWYVFPFKLLYDYLITRQPNAGFLGHKKDNFKTLTLTCRQYSPKQMICPKIVHRSQQSAASRVAVDRSLRTHPAVCSPRESNSAPIRNQENVWGFYPAGGRLMIESTVYLPPWPNQPPLWIWTPPRTLYHSMTTRWRSRWRSLGARLDSEIGKFHRKLE